MQEISAVGKTSEAVADGQYRELLGMLHERFSDAVSLNPPLFTTSVYGLYDLFLAELPDEIRHIHLCRACRLFVERFGGLVTIDGDGRLHSAMWRTVACPVLFLPAVMELSRTVRRASVTGVFLSSLPTWGTPFSDKSKKDIKLGRGPWHHFAAQPPKAALYQGRLKTAEQMMAEKHEEYGILRRALAEFSLEHVNQAVALLEGGDALYRSEKVLGPAKWLQALHNTLAERSKTSAENLIWRAVATAPAGFCHPRSSMVGTLLEDLASGLPMKDVQRRFAAKMDPLQYQRPQALPTAGNIAEAEKIVEKLGISPSLKRRYARVEEVDAVWRPTEPASAPPTGGVFDHLTPKGKTKKNKGDFVVPATKMTWVKFRDTVLPDVVQIEYYAESTLLPFCAMTTAIDPEAPPILQWDMPERRNPFAWYLWAYGSAPMNWRLQSSCFHKVTAITLLPPHWYGRQSPNHGNAIILLLEGARETRFSGGLALFPECLKSDLHAVRATIEAFSHEGKLEGAEEATACGIKLMGSNWNARIRVTTRAGIRAEYILDRWD